MKRGFLAGLVAIMLGCAGAMAESRAEALFQALERTCPQARWSHATMGGYEAPLAALARGLSPARARGFHPRYGF
jgi:hypothetical protein